MSLPCSTAETAATATGTSLLTHQVKSLMLCIEGVQGLLILLALMLALGAFLLLCEGCQGPCLSPLRQLLVHGLSCLLHCLLSFLCNAKTLEKMTPLCKTGFCLTADPPSSAMFPCETLGRGGKGGGPKVSHASFGMCLAASSAMQKEFRNPVSAACLACSTGVMLCSIG